MDELLYYSYSRGCIREYYWSCISLHCIVPFLVWVTFYNLLDQKERTTMETVGKAYKGTCISTYTLNPRLGFCTGIRELL